MRNLTLSLAIVLLPLLSYAQPPIDDYAIESLQSFYTADISSPAKRKLYQHNHGAIAGLQRGAGSAVELGYEAHWRKISLFNPHIIGASTNLEYNVSDNVIGYKAGFWMKRGRINLTYGGNLVYFTDFQGNHRYGLGPSVGFRLAGFHLINGLNILAGDKELEGANTLHMSLRYYFPRHNQFTWDKQTRKKKEQKRKAKEREKESREEKKGIHKLLDFKL